MLVVALVAAAAWQVVRHRPDGRAPYRIGVHTNLMPLFREATLVRTTEVLLPGTPRDQRYTFEVDRRLGPDAHGLLSRPDGDPPFAWCVGRRVELELDVLERVDRRLKVFVADATETGQTVRVLLGGRLVAEGALPSSGKPVRLEGEVPAGAQRHGRNRLALEFERTVSRELVGEPVALPLSGVLTRVIFEPTTREAIAHVPDLEIGLRRTEDERLVAVPARTKVELGLRVPDEPRCILQLAIARSDVQFEVGLTTDEARRVVLYTGTLDERGARELKLDLSPWAAQAVALDVWARQGNGDVRFSRAALLAPRSVDADDDGADDATPETAPSGDDVVPDLATLVASLPERPSFLIVVLDALARDHVGSLGYDRPTSPVLDLMSTRSFVFRHATAPASYTLASVGSLLTGQHPRHHRVLEVESGGAVQTLGRRTPTLAGVLGEHGWRTAALVTNPNAGARHGYGHGFERYDELFADPALWDDGVDGLALPARLAELLADVAGEPFLVYVHVFEPHAPYEAPADLLERFVRPYDGPIDGSRASLDLIKTGAHRATDADLAHLRDLYDARIAYADRVLGALLAEVSDAGRADETVLVVVSDHGEAFGQHGTIEHGDGVYGEQIDVPLMIRLPSMELPRRVNGPASVTDVAPTVLALAGIDAPASMDGVDLLAGPLERSRPQLARSHGTFLVPASWSWTRGPLKLVVNLGTRRVELFDLGLDPEERDDLSAERPATTAWLFRELCRAACSALADARTADDATGAALDDEQLEQLAAIGYASFAADADADAGADALGVCPLRELQVRY